MGNPVVHFEVTVGDDAKAREFYGGLFGGKFQSMPEMGYSLVDTDSGGKGIAGGIGRGGDSQFPLVTFYVEVDDVQAALDRAVELGGSIVQPPTVAPGVVTTAIFADAEGSRVGLVGATPPGGE